MNEELRQRVLVYNRSVAENKEKADDFMTVLGALPPGQVKNLLKDPTIGPILKKYGITGK